jgi:hypothetical protein
MCGCAIRTQWVKAREGVLWAPGKTGETGCIAVQILPAIPELDQHSLMDRKVTATYLAVLKCEVIEGNAYGTRHLRSCARGLRASERIHLDTDLVEELFEDRHWTERLASQQWVRNWALIHTMQSQLISVKGQGWSNDRHGDTKNVFSVHLPQESV